MENGQPVVQRQVEGDPGLIDGPAKEAGLKAGDKLIMIGAQPTKGWDAGKVVQVLRGQEHSQVVVSIERQGEAKPFEKAIIRRVIVSKEGSDLYGSRSLCARETGDREGASRDAQMAYALDSDNVAAREALAAVKLDGGKYQESITLLAPLKDDPFATILQATAYAKQGDAKLAVDTYARIPEEELLAKRALRQNAKKALLQALQGYVQQRLDHARVSEAAGSFVEALTDYADAMKIADDATADLIRQRVAATLKGHAYLTELPEEARKHAVRGDVLIKEGNFANALTEYQAAVKLAPFNAQLHFNTALIHGQLKDFRKAIKAMNVYLQLNPDASNMRAAKDEIYRWELALEREGKK
jgi:tetratricopeptide (TPR) repeat protein